MKNLLTAVFLLVALSATAQEFKPFKVNLSLGYARSLGAGVSGGFLVAAEPKYGITDNIDLGLRMEAAFVLRGVVDNGQTLTADAGVFGSYLLTGNYLFGTGSIRPFLGAGVGFYRIGAAGTTVIDKNGNNEEIKFVNDTKFGGMIRAGIKAGHFVASVEYNAAPTSKATVGSITAGTVRTISSENAYLGIKLGFDIGGGRY